VRPAVPLICQFIDEHRERFGVVPVCRALSAHGIQIAPGTCWARQASGPGKRALWDMTVTEILAGVYEPDVNGRRPPESMYGTVKMWGYLQRQGIEVARCTIERLKRAHGWRGVTRARRPPRTTVADPGATRAPDLVRRQFRASRPGELVVADFTYVPMDTSRFGYTAFVVDAFAGFIPGWECSLSKKTAFVEAAIRQAAAFRARQGRPFTGKEIHHSDAGSQGGFNRSSQYLQVEVGEWDGQGDGRLLGRDGPAMRSPGRPPVARREHRQRFWVAIARGMPSEDAGIEAGVSPAVGTRWFRDSGGIRPVSLALLSGRYLSFAEREEIAILRVRGCGVREIARRVGRSPSTISRELRRNAATRGGRLEYRATTAQWHADQRARRPKTAKLAANQVLREYVQDRLAGTISRPDGAAVAGPDVRWIGRRHGRRADRRWARSWSPEQIANRLRTDFTAGHTSCRQAAMAASSRSAAWREGNCTLHPIRCTSRSAPARVYSAPNCRQMTSVIRASVQH